MGGEVFQEEEDTARGLGWIFEDVESQDLEVGPRFLGGILVSEGLEAFALGESKGDLILGVDGPWELGRVGFNGVLIFEEEGF